eukprot:10585944-Ditylum_brightwellii.AAC.1
MSNNKEVFYHTLLKWRRCHSAKMKRACLAEETSKQWMGGLLPHHGQPSVSCYTSECALPPEKWNEFPQSCVVSSWGLLSSPHLGGYTSTKHVASTGDMCNSFIAFSAEVAERIYCLLVDFVADEVGGHSLVLCSTNDCFGFTMETGSFQPLMGLGKINLWDFFLLRKRIYHA